MSGSSPREKAGLEAQKEAAFYQQQFGNIALPEMSSILRRITGSLSGGPDVPPSEVTGLYDKLRGNLNQAFDNAIVSDKSSIRQSLLQSGQQVTSGEMEDITRASALGLERRRMAGERELKYQEAQTGLAQFNNLMGMLGGGARAGMGIGGSSLGLMTGAAGMMPGMSRGEAGMTGAMAGASAGSAAGGWGALIGAILGGAGGYFGGGGG